MKRDPEFFGEQELELVYIAKKLKEALALEKLLSDRAVDYLVEPDHYSGGIIFRTTRVGAFFYVTPDDNPAVRSLLSENGYKPYSAG
jgi:hypothetical protein